MTSTGNPAERDDDATEDRESGDPSADDTAKASDAITAGDTGSRASDAHAGDDAPPSNDDDDGPSSDEDADDEAANKSKELVGPKSANADIPKDAPGWRRIPPLPPRVQRLLGPQFYFVLSWMTLNVMFNLRAPTHEPPAWYLLPSLDVAVLLGLFALAGLLKVRVHRLAVYACVGFALFARIYRVSDGIVGRMYNRDVNAFVDIPMLPELGRLMVGTLPVSQLVLAVVLIVAGLTLLAWINYRALSFAANHLRVHRNRVGFASVVALFAVASVLPIRMPRPELFDGAFAASLVPRLARDYGAYQRSSEFAESIEEKVQANRQRFASGAWNLRGLNGSNVYLLFFESYGETLVTRDVYKPTVFEQYARMERALGSKGFSFASTIYDSPTVGGYSWFAHSTLATGIKVTDQRQFLALKRAHPPTLVHAFKNAGYMTTTVMPATMRPPRGPDLYDFETHFYSWEFGYRGVNFSWAPMPDQFALDFVRRNHIDKLDRPLFLEYGMVSSHAPWNDQAPLIPDWDQIGDGSIYRTLEHVRYPTTWDNLEQAQGPYLRSVLYVLEVLLRYIYAYVNDDSLFIVVGDHQPVGEITAHTESRGAIMHVISRNPTFTDKFVRHGFARGMRPKSPTPRLGMEAFLPMFMEEFSAKD